LQKLGLKGRWKISKSSFFGLDLFPQKVYNESSEQAIFQHFLVAAAWRAVQYEGEIAV